MKEIKVNGERLRELRGTTPLSELEHRTGVSRGLLSRLERGQRTSQTRVETLARLARFYGVSIDDLMGE